VPGARVDHAALAAAEVPAAALKVIPAVPAVPVGLEMAGAAAAPTVAPAAVDPVPAGALADVDAAVPVAALVIEAPQFSAVPLVGVPFSAVALVGVPFEAVALVGIPFEGIRFAGVGFAGVKLVGVPVPVVPVAAMLVSALPVAASDAVVPIDRAGSDTAARAIGATWPDPTPASPAPTRAALSGATEMVAPGVAGTGTADARVIPPGRVSAMALSGPGSTDMATASL